MPVKIRLSKKGRKKLPFYHIVVADSRAPRDGKFVERIGMYNPQTNPATIELNFDRALDWLQKGAQPTDTCRAILSEKGVLIKKHLLEGAKKGAFSEDEAEARFQKWMSEKEARIKSQADKVSKVKADEQKKKLDAETKIKEAKAEALAKKLKAKSEEAEAGEQEITEEEVISEATTEQESSAAEPAETEAAVDAPSQEEPVKEEPVAEQASAEEPVTEEPAVEKETAEEPVAEETSSEEPKAEETEAPAQEDEKKDTPEA